MEQGHNLKMSDQPAACLSDHAPDDIQRKMKLDGGIEEDPDFRGEFVISFPEDVSERDLREYLQGEPLVSIEDFSAAQPPAGLQKCARVLSVPCLQLCNLKTVRASEECGTSKEVFLADPGMGGFDVLCFGQINQGHEIEKWLKFLFNGLIVPFDPKDFSSLRKDEVSQIIDRQYESFPAGIVDGLCSIADVRRMKL